MVEKERKKALPEGMLLRTERSMIPPVGHPRRAKYEECIQEAGKVLADAYDTGKVRLQEEDLQE